MKKKQDILKNISESKPTLSFNDKVMDEIFKIDNEKKIANSIFIFSAVETSLNFTSTVMNEILLVENEKASIPIYSKIQKTLIFIGLISVLILSFISKGNTTILNLDIFKFEIAKYFKLSFNTDIPSVISYSIFSILVLLIIDFYINKSKKLI